MLLGLWSFWLQLGSKLVSLNGQVVTGKSYVETLDLVKTLPRPLTLVMEKVGGLGKSKRAPIRFTPPPLLPVSPWLSLGGFV